MAYYIELVDNKIVLKDSEQTDKDLDSLVKGEGITTLSLDTISEKTAAAGVTIDGILLKDDLDTSGIVGKTITQILTNKRITKRVNTIASSATPTPAGDTTDLFTITALAEAAEFAVPTGTPTNGQSLIIRIKDNGTARALTWNAIYRGIIDALPTTTTISKTMYIGFMYNIADSKWDMLALAEES